MFLNSSSVIYESSDRRLQEVYRRRFEIRRTPRAAKDEIKDTCCVKLFNDCSSLSVPETPSHLDSWRNFWDLKPKNEGGIWFFPTLPSMSWVVYFLFLNAGFFFFHFIWPTTSSLFFVGFVGFIVVVKEIYISVACDIGEMFWTYNLCFPQLADRCFSCTMFRLVPTTYTFIVIILVCSPIGLVRTRRLNLRFRLLLR